MRAMANWNGEITLAEEARIPIFDRGFLYGDSIYEVVRTYKHVPFFHEEHLDRLENSARLAQIKITQTRSFLKEEIRRTVLATNPEKDEDVFIRYTITRGSGPITLNPLSTSETSYLILVTSIPEWNPNYYTNGTNLLVPKTRRNSPLALDPNIKSGNYLNSVLAAGEAAQAKCDDALMLSIDGKVTEATNSNVCFIFNNEVHAPLHEPHTNTGNLKGITKEIVKKICAKINLKFTERAISPAEIEKASEAFQCSATREVMPIATIQLENGKKVQFPIGGGKVVKQLRTAYSEFIEEYVRTHSNEALF